MNQRVCLTTIDPALGVADDYGHRTRICQHFGGNVACMGAGFQRMAVLRAKQDRRTSRTSPALG